MRQHWILREPTLAFGLPVYLVAAIVLPLHLGWIGISWLLFAGYLVIAAGLFAVADALLRPIFYPRRATVVSQLPFSLIALTAPAVLAFAIGSFAGPVDERFDETACASQGAAEADTPEAEADDTFDVTPDCVTAV